MLTSALALMVDRAVRAASGGDLGPLRRLMRSIGMGGTASALFWVMGYDPLVYIVAMVLGRRCPTYVDDMSALLRGPHNVAVGQLLLLGASHAAGLHVEGHWCATLHVTRRAT